MQGGRAVRAEGGKLGGGRGSGRSRGKKTVLFFIPGRTRRLTAHTAAAALAAHLLVRLYTRYICKSSATVTTTCYGHSHTCVYSTCTVHTPSSYRHSPFVATVALSRVSAAATACSISLRSAEALLWPSTGLRPPPPPPQPQPPRSDQGARPRSCLHRGGRGGLAHCTSPPPPPPQPSPPPQP